MDYGTDIFYKLWASPLSLEFACTLTLYLIFLLVASTVIIPTIVAQPSFAQLAAPKEKIILTAMFVELHTNREMGKFLLDSALAKLKMMYPNLDIQLKYLDIPIESNSISGIKST